ncbi:unnamed protein product, partial [Discosporangium mesarthrocarpum]
VEDPSRLPDDELKQGLVPRLTPIAQDKERRLTEKAKAHQEQCQRREALWEKNVSVRLTVAEEARKRAIRRGTKKGSPAGHKWWEDMESRFSSGWLSQEQLAASEFGRQVALKQGIGVVASNIKKR